VATKKLALLKKIRNRIVPRVGIVFEGTTNGESLLPIDKDHQPIDMEER
jgi:hypothetical protein